MSKLPTREELYEYRGALATGSLKLLRRTGAAEPLAPILQMALTLLDIADLLRVPPDGDVVEAVRRLKAELAEASELLSISGAGGGP